MNRQYRRTSSLSTTLKDYFIPIVGFVLIIILIYSFFSGDDTNTKTQNLENRTWYELDFWSVDTEAFIEYTWGKKEKIENATKIFKWEKLIVKEWNVSLDIWNNTHINVDKIWEMKFNSDNSYSLFSSNMWISSWKPFDIDMRYAKIKSSSRATLSLSQNEVGSSIYVLDGTVEVKNLSGQATFVGKWQKITISRIDASKEDIDLSLSKNDLDNYFKWSDWFLENNGASFLLKKEEEISWTWSSDSTTEMKKFSSILNIDSIKDESNVTEKTMNITGNFSNDEIVNITMNGITAKVNTTEKTFEIKNLPTEKKVNDFVIKVYNGSNELLSKYVYTLYNPTGIVSKKDSLFKVENYSLDATKFQFISPKQNPYTTKAWVVMLEWRVPAGSVKKIQINGYTLRKFPQYGTYWAYFANEKFGNLKTWLNVYKVEYIGKDGNILHSNAFSIIKTVEKKEEVISDEAPANS